MSDPYETDANVHDDAALRAGRRLNAKQVTNLERLVQADPSDPLPRIKLASCYLDGKVDVQSGLLHIVWLIDNFPRMKVWRHSLSMGYRRPFHPELCAAVREHWLSQIEKHPEDPKILGNAGLCLIRSDIELGDQLLERAMLFDPEEDYWPWRLSDFYFRMIEQEPVGVTPKPTRRALELGEHFLRLYGSEGGRGSSAVRARALLLCARCALRLGRLDLAKHYGQIHILLIKNWQEGPKSGESILGLVAVKENDISSAKRHLLSVKEELRPDLWDLELANELIQLGELEAVADYLKKCKRARQWRDRAIDDWIIALRDGKPVELA